MGFMLNLRPRLGPLASALFALGCLVANAGASAADRTKPAIARATHVDGTAKKRNASAGLRGKRTQKTTVPRQASELARIKFADFPELMRIEQLFNLPALQLDPSDDSQPEVDTTSSSTTSSFGTVTRELTQGGGTVSKTTTVFPAKGQPYYHATITNAGRPANTGYGSHAIVAGAGGFETPTGKQEVRRGYTLGKKAGPMRKLIEQLVGDVEPGTQVEIFVERTDRGQLSLAIRLAGGAPYSYDVIRESASIVFRANAPLPIARSTWQAPALPQPLTTP